jgi:uncharacterized lipoprotein YmbA
MKPARLRLFVVTLSLALALAACASAPPSKLITLPAVPSSPAASAGSEGVLVVGRIDLPEYLLSTRVRYRTADGALAEWPATLWAERIESGVRREWAAALAQQLPAWTVCLVDCSGLRPRVTVGVAFLRLDYLRPQRRLVADVRVDLRGDCGAAARTFARPYDIASTGDDALAQAAATRELLDRVAVDVAARATHCVAANPLNPRSVSHE